MTGTKQNLFVSKNNYSKTYILIDSPVNVVKRVIASMVSWIGRYLIAWFAWLNKFINLSYSLKSSHENKREGLWHWALIKCLLREQKCAIYSSYS